MSQCSSYGGGNCSPHVTLPVSTPVVTVPSSTPHASGLAFTGGDALGVSGIGVGLVIIGVALTRRFPFNRAGAST